jgi:hypothetical protein
MQWIIKFCLVLLSLGSIHLQAKNAKTKPLTIEISEYEKELYLTPAGKYTLDDIAANGNLTRSQKFRDYVSSHKPQLNKGDAICPISSTKANPTCTWTIGGKSYQFCCPSCIDEFVALAKKSPEQIQDPAYYVMLK